MAARRRRRTRPMKTFLSLAIVVSIFGFFACNAFAEQILLSTAN